MFRRALLRLKKSGKPMETPDYKYVYAPWDDNGPTPDQIKKAHEKFKRPVFHHILRKPVEVSKVPENMYTYGKEGMSVPISIFKDQSDPVIGPEWTYPGIYENKRMKVQSYEELVRKQEEGTISGWEQQSLQTRTRTLIARHGMKLNAVKIKNWLPLSKEKGKKPKSRAESAAQKKAEAKK
eukprot:PhM_4_TR11202/c0_g1_i1/m.34124